MLPLQACSATLRLLPLVIRACKTAASCKPAPAFPLCRWLGPDDPTEVSVERSTYKETWKGCGGVAAAASPLQRALHCMPCIYSNETPAHLPAACRLPAHCCLLASAAHLPRLTCASGHYLPLQRRDCEGAVWAAGGPGEACSAALADNENLRLSRGERDLGLSVVVFGSGALQRLPSTRKQVHVSVHLYARHRRQTCVLAVLDMQVLPYLDGDLPEEPNP